MNKKILFSTCIIFFAILGTYIFYANSKEKEVSNSLEITTSNTKVGSDEIATTYESDNEYKVSNSATDLENELPVNDSSKRVIDNSKENLTKESQNNMQLSTKHRIDVVQQIQKTPTNCAPTTVSMMLSTRGITVPQEQLAIEMGTTNTWGTHNKDAIRILNKHLIGRESPAADQTGYRIARVTDPSINSEDMILFKKRLVENFKSGYPMYYTIELSSLYPEKKGEHNVIGTGYKTSDDGSEIIGIYYVDPLASMQDPVYAGLKVITPEELLSAMSVCVEPNYAW
ncbi:C39 family peptidase [Floricoccus penangensis]|uniref:C39 family peptidase n=1 Tax=Floricoccus penangensis TaxID=1859475 RepID=UPI00203AB583|nr:C39 family peptidase [Floricoccus penangensis]URZ88324.1 C39 family peptidase [Floricoccus penangensis]